MNYEIIAPDHIHIDINNLVDYVFFQTYSFSTAQKVHNALYLGINSLKIFPYRYQIYFSDYRRVIVLGSYRIIYKIDEEHKKVIIVRIVRVEGDYLNSDDN